MGSLKFNTKFSWTALLGAMFVLIQYFFEIEFPVEVQIALGIVFFSLLYAFSRQWYVEPADKDPLDITGDDTR